jgi:hypothetical protein
MAAVLTSWKEIAQFLGKGVRTVQRYEAELGLPVRRPSPRDRHIVLATREDLANWLERMQAGDGKGRNGHKRGNGKTSSSRIPNSEASLDERLWQDDIVLKGWKEIARFFGKGVRTVQRWDHELGLPVRKDNLEHRWVVATSEELLAWIQELKQSSRNNTLT